MIRVLTDPKEPPPGHGARDWFFDNLKACLITLVVVSHFMLGFRTMERLYNVIYVFHMPLFVFVSGVFSRTVFRNGRFRYNRLMRLLVSYLGFVLADALLRFCFHPELGFAVPMIYIHDAQWYLFSLLLWSLSVPLVKDVKPWIALLVSVGAALAAGMFQPIGAVFAMSRTIVLYPYFLAGLYVDADRLKTSLRKPWVVWTCLPAAAAVTVLILWQKDFFQAQHALLYRESCYQFLPGLLGPVYRLLLGVMTVILSLGCMLLVPRRKMWFSYLGERSLQIYILHALVYKALDGWGVLPFVRGLPPVQRILCLLFPLGLTWLLGQRIFSIPFDALKRIPFEKALTRFPSGMDGDGPA